MELRQLSYFILACQHKNHAEAAAQAGISASALSENLNLLEQELGIKLFQRGPIGHFPSEAARWLYQNVEPVLQLVETAESALPFDDPTQFSRLEITTPLQFMLGRLSRAASLAVRALREEHPQVVARVRFRADAIVGEKARPVPGQAEGQPVENITIDYAGEHDLGQDTLLFEDDWIAITNFNRSAEQGRVISFADLRGLPLLLPPLLPAQIQHARNYCLRHGLPAPVVIEEDVGTFPRLSRDARPFALLAPRSLVAGGLSRLQLDHVSLPAELTSPVVARASAGGSSANAYLQLLQKILKEPDRSVLYNPGITLRQMRYFLTLLDQLNMTAAARKLHVVQPALSNQLRKLESVVGKPLFERHRTGLKPTSGTHALAYLFNTAVKKCEHVAARASRFASAQGERLSIGVIPLVNHNGALVEALAGALDEWTNAFPNVKLQVVEAPANALRRWVEAGQISFGIVEAHVSRSLQLDLHSQDKLVVVARAGSKLLPPGDVTFAQVTTMPLVLPSDIFGLRQLLDRAAESTGLSITPQMEVNSLPMVLALVRRMQLVTVMPEASVRPFVSEGIFQFNPIVDPVIYRRLSIVFSTDRSLTEIERALVGTLRRHLVSVDFNSLEASDNGQDDVPAHRTEVH